MESHTGSRRVLLLDSINRAIGSGILESPPDGKELQVRVTDGREDEVAGHDLISVVGLEDRSLLLQCRLLRSRGERVVLERITPLDDSVLRNLRVPVRFGSFIYPISGAWRGRREIQSVDLSCGGVAFYGEPVLAQGEEFEIVLPVTTRPLLLRCRVLRQQELTRGRCFFAAKFLDMCDDEETAVREAVFRIQLMNRTLPDGAAEE